MIQQKNCVAVFVAVAFSGAKCYLGDMALMLKY